MCHLSTHDVGWRLNISMHGSSGVRGGGAGGESTPPKLLIWWKPSNLWKCGQILWILWQNRCMCFDFTKVSAEIKCRLFWRSYFHTVLFGQDRWNLGKLGENLGTFGENVGKCGGWSALIVRNAPNVKGNALVFCFVSGGHFLWSIFGARLRKFVHKSFAHAKICLLLHICMEQPPLLIQAQRMLEWSLTGRRSLTFKPRPRLTSLR